jgi:hypothetical protein
MRKGKKEIKEVLKPQPITYKFTPDQMIFSINGQELSLPRSEASFLFGRNAELEFEKVSNQDEDFSEFQTMENLALLSFHSRRHMPVREIAKELNFPVDKYVRWMNRRSKVITELLATHRVEIEARIAELEKENPLPEPKKEKPFWPNALGSTGKKVAVMLLDGLKPRQIAEQLKAPYDKFLKWYTSKEVQRCIMRMQNEEGEKRRRAAEKDAA